jgi:hypothetical protein
LPEINDYLVDAVNALRDSFRTSLSQVTRVEIGYPHDGLTDVSATQCAVFLVATRGQHQPRGMGTTNMNRTYLEARFYWLLTAMSREVVEFSTLKTIMEIVDVYTELQPRILSDVATFSIVGTAGASLGYDLGYEDIGGKRHRVLIYPIELWLKWG